MEKLTKITFEYWAGLASGRIQTIHGAAGTSVRLVNVAGLRFFVMENRRGHEHTLLESVTDEKRLNDHFQGFQMEAASHSIGFQKEA